LSKLTAASDACELERCIIERSVELTGELSSDDREQTESEDEQDYCERPSVP